MGHCLTLKNKLEKELFEDLKEQSRIVISDINLEMFKSMILMKVAELNLIYNRCNPIKAGWTDIIRTDKNHDWKLTGFGAVQFFLYESKK